MWMWVTYDMRQRHSLVLYKSVTASNATFILVPHIYIPHISLNDKVWPYTTIIRYIPMLWKMFQLFLCMWTQWVLNIILYAYFTKKFVTNSLKMCSLKWWILLILGTAFSANMWVLREYGCVIWYCFHCTVFSFAFVSDSTYIYYSALHVQILMNC